MGCIIRRLGSGARGAACGGRSDLPASRARAKAGAHGMSQRGGNVKHRGMITLGVLGVCACSGNDGVKVSVTSITVTPASAKVLVGWTLRLDATPKDASGIPLGAQAVSWRSVNPSIATV